MSSLKLKFASVGVYATIAALALLSIRAPQCQTAPKLSPAQMEEVDKSILKSFPNLTEQGDNGRRCMFCHENAANDVHLSIHKESGMLSKLPEGTLCLTCHEKNHKFPLLLTKEKNGELDPAVKEAIKADIAASHKENDKIIDLPCVRCHQDPVLAKAYGFSAHVPSEFEQTMHYRKALLGVKRAPLCYDCHGAHAVLAVKNPSSPVNEFQRAKVCAKCHDGANITFASTFDHKPIQKDNKAAEYWTIVLFKTLTLGTFLALSLFVFLDVFTFIRLSLTPSHKKELHHVLPATKKRYVKRLDFHMRMQHFLMLASVITLALTGWPLLEPNTSTAQFVIKLFGGPVLMPIIHRIAGLVMIGDFVYHLIFLYLKFQAGKHRHPMLPKLKDFTDLVGMMLFYVGLRKSKPKFEEFSFIEKFDYWAVFWGVVMMGVSGLVLMFPNVVTRLFPAIAVKLSSIVHADEALLAATVLFIWHFYNVHLKPGIFPMNWAWLTGRMRADIYEEEHAAHVETLRTEGNWEISSADEAGASDPND